MPEKSHDDFLLNSENTTWVFVAGAAEQRHLQDVVWAVFVLIGRGVPFNRIVLFSDHPFARQHMSFFPGICVESLVSIGSRYKELVETEHAVVVVTGHGSHEGIPIVGSPPIPPHPFVQILKSAPRLGSVALVLAQCYAGVFNYLNVRGAPKTCIIGATNLHVSLSVTSQIPLSIPQADGKMAVVNLQWDANVFMLRFFRWIMRPHDLDGDGKISLLDGYRLAGAWSNDEFRNLKTTENLKIEKLKAEIHEIETSQTNPDPSGIRVRQLQDEIEQSIAALHFHQEPWILYPDLARCIILA